MRTILDPINPDDLRPLYTEVFNSLQRAKVLEGYQQFPGQGFTLLRVVVSSFAFVNSYWGVLPHIPYLEIP
jgi:hypothetical protein